VRSVHLERGEVPDSSLEAIRDELSTYGVIFTTSYDLLVYWAIGFEEEYGDFCDCFWGAKHGFDAHDTHVRAGRRPVYYVHGALHLIVEGSGQTRKLIHSEQTILDQFGKPRLGDRDARPLLITEGSARDKLRAIEGNDYLSHVYETFKCCDSPLVVFGHSMGTQDQHLLDAINANPGRPVAVSMRSASPQQLRERQAAIWGKLGSREVYFFDAESHPLGSSDLTRKRPRRRLVRWSGGGR
jgi:hypothetical protein